MPKQIPVVDYLELGDTPHLTSRACSSCGALYFDRRNACAKCFGREFGRKDLSNQGTVRAFTFVHRVKRPYVSVIVDLDGGGVVKANLRGVDDPDAVTPRMPVELETYVAGTDDEGTEAVAFGYRPREEQGAQA
ncbi:Zn-ribbon domain-containing OB-fold protein [Pseudonocardia acidicola]|uniref:DUF35 domain-containing protein n=1 Tax=Pseudonocardia acidicola TaxID=2724939 RepID=A0ABX1S9I6_9PSEU|nr:OB-fold domain-containing protein [Pseudonocardia acidicola]NMH98216.1 hypothetical protein [Pseudonocardia acidicola]